LKNVPLATAARYLFAYNQTPARHLLDPMYRLVSRALVGGKVPLSKALAERKYADNLYEGYRARSRKLQYYIEDWDFSQARPELLTARERRVVHTTTLGETSGMAVSDGFLRAFRNSEELASFFGTWFVEELNHFRGFHRYTARMGEAWPFERIQGVAQVEFQPYSDDPFEIAAANCFQELLAFLVYRSFGNQVKDPFLARMVKQFSKDELRHYKFYQDVVARQIQREPKLRSTVLKVFLKATTPFNQVSGGAKETLDHVLNGLFYFRAAEYEYFMDQVEFLMGTRLDDVFSASFRMLTGSCARCGERTFQCGCAEYEPHPRADGITGRLPR
jgi:hypothetical protein